MTSTARNLDGMDGQEELDAIEALPLSERAERYQALVDELGARLEQA